ncbi:hypothetical protein CKO12_05425 [Chromatium okenii]|nr:hypothetical protein [Chromatium okenii]
MAITVCLSKGVAGGRWALVHKEQRQIAANCADIAQSCLVIGVPECPERGWMAWDQCGAAAMVRRIMLN